MPTYMVYVKEVWEQGYKVEADSVEEAISKVEGFETEPQEDWMELCHRLPADQWTVYDAHSSEKYRDPQLGE